MSVSLMPRSPFLLALSSVIASQSLLACTPTDGDRSAESAGLVILESGEKYDLADGVTMHVIVTDYVGGEASILWTNSTNDRVLIDVEAPLAVTEHMKAMAGRTEPTECVRREQRFLEGAFAAGWNISHVVVSENSWNHSYIAGLIHEDRGCLVALRVSVLSEPARTHDILIDGVNAAPVAAGSNEVATREIQTDLKIESITGAVSQESGVRIDILVRNPSQSEVLAKSSLVRLNCASGLILAESSSRDWLAELTRNGPPREVSPRSWAVLSHVLISRDSWTDGRGCEGEVFVTVLDKLGRRVWSGTIPFNF